MSQSSSFEFEDGAIPRIRNIGIAAVIVGVALIIGAAILAIRWLAH